MAVNNPIKLKWVYEIRGIKPKGGLSYVYPKERGRARGACELWGLLLCTLRGGRDAYVYYRLPVIQLADL